MKRGKIVFMPPPITRLPAPSRPWPGAKEALTLAVVRSCPLPSDRPEPAPAPISEIAEMWKDYRVFKAAGLLREWRRKWAAYLPDPT